MESSAASERTSKLWKSLAEKFAVQADDAADEDETAKAIILACCAEACLWKSTGEADGHNINDVLSFFARPAQG